jgi:ELWxxDGT repeat protein
MAQLVFFADDGSRGRELWTTDGTAEGTRMLADIWPGGGGVDSGRGGGFGGPPGSIIALGDGRALFEASDPVHGSELWTTDGTAAGTRLVADLNRSEAGFSGSSPSGFAASGVGRAIFFAADSTFGLEPWVTDGTAAGTYPLIDLPQGRNINTTSLASLGEGRAVFSVFDRVSGAEPWVADGTDAGTHPIADIRPGPASSVAGPAVFSAFGDGRVLFWADDGVHGLEPWVTDGTAAGTRLVADIQPGPAPSPGPGPGGPGPSGFVVLGDGRAVFWTSDGTHGLEPWVTDGTAAGTRLVADIWPGGGGSDSGGGFGFGGFGGPPGSVVSLGDGRILFSATDPLRGTELWVSDLTAEGTRLAADINTARQGFGSSFPSDFAALGDGRAVFSADDGIRGREAWISDGTPEGTRMLADILPGAPPTSPSGGPFSGPTGFTPVSPPDWAV